MAMMDLPVLASPVLYLSADNAKVRQSGGNRRTAYAVPRKRKEITIVSPESPDPVGGRMKQESGTRAVIPPGQAVGLQLSPIVLRPVFQGFGVAIGRLMRQVGPTAGV